MFRIVDVFVKVSCVLYDESLEKFRWNARENICLYIRSKGRLKEEEKCMYHNFRVLEGFRKSVALFRAKLQKCYLQCRLKLECPIVYQRIGKLKKFVLPVEGFNEAYLVEKSNYRF